MTSALSVNSLKLSRTKRIPLQLRHSIKLCFPEFDKDNGVLCKPQVSTSNT